METRTATEIENDMESGTLNPIIQGVLKDDSQCSGSRFPV